MTIPTAQQMSAQEVCVRLAASGEASNPDRVRFHTSIQALAEKVRSSRHWEEGEIFVYAESNEEFVILKQVAPASCEMLTLTRSGFKDVLTAYLFDQEELERQLTAFLRQDQAARP